MEQYATWHTEIFEQGDAKIELTLNYQKKTLSMTHGNNDRNVSFDGNIENFELLEERLACVEQALKFAKKELIRY